MRSRQQIEQEQEQVEERMVRTGENHRTARAVVRKALHMAVTTQYTLAESYQRIADHQYRAIVGCRTTDKEKEYQLKLPKWEVSMWHRNKKGSLLMSTTYVRAEEQASAVLEGAKAGRHVAKVMGNIKYIRCEVRPEHLSRRPVGVSVSL